MHNGQCLDNQLCFLSKSLWSAIASGQITANINVMFAKPWQGSLKTAWHGKDISRLNWSFIQWRIITWWKTEALIIHIFSGSFLELPIDSAAISKELKEHWVQGFLPMVQIRLQQYDLYVMPSFTALFPIRNRNFRRLEYHLKFKVKTEQEFK